MFTNHFNVMATSCDSLKIFKVISSNLTNLTKIFFDKNSWNPGPPVQFPTVLTITHGLLIVNEHIIILKKKKQEGPGMNISEAR